MYQQHAFNNDIIHYKLILLNYLHNFATMRNSPQAEKRQKGAPSDTPEDRPVVARTQEVPLKKDGYTKHGMVGISNDYCLGCELP